MLAGVASCAAFSDLPDLPTLLDGCWWLGTLFFCLGFAIGFLFVVIGRSKIGGHWIHTIYLSGTLLVCLPRGYRAPLPRSNSGEDNEIIGVDSTCGRPGQPLAA
jgi:hypothetical protein